MTLQKFIIVAVVFFLLGIAILHSGRNREPFRHGGSSQTLLVILGGSASCLGISKGSFR